MPEFLGPKMPLVLDIVFSCVDEEEPAATTAIPFPVTGIGPELSRLATEFSYISEIGKGGFGEVMKVKNNLDKQVYAIKKIKLNPKNKTVMRKIMREVKLLSRLNHENVVSSDGRVAVFLTLDY